MATDLIEVEGNLRIRQVSGQGRNRERATENSEEFTLLSISRSAYVHEAPSLQGRFISSFSRFPYHYSFVHTYYIYMRASSSRFLLCASILRWEYLTKSICPILIQYYLMCTFYLITCNFFHLTDRNIEIFD